MVNNYVNRQLSICLVWFREALPGITLDDPLGDPYRMEVKTRGLDDSWWFELLNLCPEMEIVVQHYIYIHMAFAVLWATYLFVKPLYVWYLRFQKKKVFGVIISPLTTALCWCSSWFYVVPLWSAGSVEGIALGFSSVRRCVVFEHGKLRLPERSKLPQAARVGHGGLRLRGTQLSMSL